MSLGNAINQGLNDGIYDADPAGKLDDAEIQRLVDLSKATQYQRSDRIPVKSADSFAPRSLVSIAMDAQRRREGEMRQATSEVDAGKDDVTALDRDSESVNAGTDMGATREAADNTGEARIIVESESGMQPGDADAPDAAAAGDGTAPAEAQQGAADEDATDGEASVPQIAASKADFDAGHAEGLAEGRKAGFDEGHAKGMEEGRAAGSAEASAQLERAIQAFEEATTALANLTEVDSDVLSDSLRAAVLQMASERAGQVISELPAGFVTRIEAMIDSICTVSGAPVIRLNASDLAAIAPLVDTREKLAHCRFVADQDLVSGDLSVTVGNIGIDDFLLDGIASEANAGAGADGDAGADGNAGADGALERKPDIAAASAADMPDEAVVPEDNQREDDVGEEGQPEPLPSAGADDD